MTTEKMTLTQALSELKIISNRLHYEIENATFCGVKKHMDTNVKGVSVDEAKKSMQASFDKVTNLINRQEAIKKALTKANAETSIVVAGKPMMIAEALYLKKGLDGRKELLKRLVNQYNSAVKTANSDNIAIASACAQYVQNVYGKDSTTPSSPDRAAEIEAFRKQFLENQSSEIFSGFDIKETIEKMKDEIDAFEANVDSAITIANSTTVITIEY